MAVEKAYDRLQKLVELLNEKEKSLSYSLEYYKREQITPSGYVYQGYYLITRIANHYAPKPEDYNFSEYVDGELIGENYSEAKEHLISLIQTGDDIINYV